PAWQLVGHEADIPKKGDYLTVDLAADRVLVVRSQEREIRAFRNSCRRRPHALVAGGRGHLAAKITCEAHGLVYGLDGQHRSGEPAGDLTSLELALPGRFILVRPPGLPDDPPTSLLEIAGAPVGDWEALPDLHPEGSTDIVVAADWK